MTRPLLTFFALTFTATWALWGASRAITQAVHDGSPLGAFGALARPLFLLGVFMPALVAIALTNIAGTARATPFSVESLALLRRVIKWPVGARWYIFAIAFIPAIELTVAVLHRVIAGHWPRFGNEPWYLMAAAVLISTWVQAGEEIGWRGYALPRMAGRFGLGRAGILLGLVWAAWHLPIFFFAEADLFGQSFLVYALQVTALSVVMAWLYWRTRGSLLLVMLLHAAVNNFKDIVPSHLPTAQHAPVHAVSRMFGVHYPLVTWLTVLLLWLAAAAFLFQMRKVKALD